MTVSGNPNNLPITLTLAPNPGTTGVANFSGTNRSTATITQTTNIQIKGITESSTKDNMLLKATYGNNVPLDTEDFTVISLALSLRFTGQASMDNTARTVYQQAVGTYDLGGPFLSSGTAATLWRIGIEIKTTVLPANFSKDLKLKREIVSTQNHIRENTAGTFMTNTFCNGNSLPQPPCDDTSDAILRDDVPSSIYDLDAPGQYFSSAAQIGRILRRRINFRQWVTISQRNGGTGVEDVRVSADIEWYFRQSIIKSTTGTVDVLSDVTGDNTIGAGTTPLGANL